MTSEALPSSRVLTVPNLLSALRLAGVPLFLYWVLVTEQDGRAILLLMAAGISDYADGKIARKYGQFSRLGQLLDPAADRLYILATLIALVARDGLPWGFAVALIARDVVLACGLLLLRAHGYGPLPVNFLGKAATFNLLYAFPMLLAALPERQDLAGDGVPAVGLGVHDLGDRPVLGGRPRVRHPGAAARARRPAGARGAGGLRVRAAS